MEDILKTHIHPTGSAPRSRTGRSLQGHRIVYYTAGINDKKYGEK